jgi:16S rRNA (uracil1498-N3)-methyltransferase
MPTPEDFGDVGHAHRGTRVSGIGLLYRVHGEDADGVADLGVGGHEARTAAEDATKHLIITQGGRLDKADAPRHDSGMSGPDQKPLSVAAHCHVDARLGPGARVGLPRELAHHLGRVLRLADGTAISLFDGSGPVWLGRLRLAGGPVTAEVIAPLANDRESPLRIVLGQGISSGDRMDYTVQKAVELGVAGIAPLRAARAVVKLTGDRAERRREHWQRIAIAACEQCRRGTVPYVEPVQDLRLWLAALPTDAPKWLLCTRESRRLIDLPRPEAGHTGYLLVGPEGGFTEEERSLATGAGLVPVRIGPRVLRTETAALVAMAAMQALWGDL